MKPHDGVFVGVGVFVGMGVSVGCWPNVVGADVHEMATSMMPATADAAPSVMSFEDLKVMFLLLSTRGVLRTGLSLA